MSFWRGRGQSLSSAQTEPFSRSALGDQKLLVKQENLSVAVIPEQAAQQQIPGGEQKKEHVPEHA